MRDIALLLCFFPMLYFAFRRPPVGIALWIWTALISPNFLVYGVADGLRYNMLAAVAAMVGVFIAKRKSNFQMTGLVFLVYLFFILTAISTMLAVYSSPVIGRELDRFFRAILLFTFCLVVLKNQRDFRLICWAIVLSLGFYSVVEGLKFIVSGGGHHIFGPDGTNLKDNNHLALAMNMMLPFAFFLLKDYKNKYVRFAFLGAIAVSVMAIVGTNSRGGFIGIAIFALAYFMVSKRKILLSTLTAIAAVGLIGFIPSSYYERISTIDNAADDSSFIGRVVAWKQSTLIALDNPLTGGGFYAVQDYGTWHYYAKDFDKVRVIDTPHASEYTFKAAHSIYFQVLGDHGILGFFVYLLIFTAAGLKAKAISASSLLQKEDEWIKDAAKACFLSLLMFGVCGSLLSLAYFELAFLNIAMVVFLSKLARQKEQAIKAARIGSKGANAHVT